MSNRVRLGLRVPGESLREFKTDISERYGTVRPVAGVLLNRELQWFANIGSIKRLHDTITALSRSLASEGSKKKGRDNPRGDSQLCQFYVSTDTRAAFMSAADSDDRGPGEIVGDLMHLHCTDGSIESREADRVARLVDVQRDTETDSPAAEIADHLGDQFVLADVKTAAKQAGYNSVSYALDRYLSDVLAVCGATWHPHNPELFVPITNDVVPSDRDPRAMPWRLMDDTDKRQALLRELREISLESSETTQPNLDVSAMRDVLDNRPQPDTVVRLARQLASDTDGVVVVKQPDWQHPRLVARDLTSNAANRLDELSQATPTATDGGTNE